jgi:hypothetical protein
MNPNNSPPKIASSSMANLEKNKVIFWGGDAKINNTLYDDAWIFDFDKMDWRLLNVNEKPGPRSFHNISKLIVNKLFLFGGTGYNDSWLLEIEPNNIKEDFIKSDLLNVKLIHNGNEYIIMNYTLLKSTLLQIELINITGRLFYEYKSEFETEGIYQKIISINDLSNGVYFINIKTDFIYKQIKFIKIN